MNTHDVFFAPVNSFAESRGVGVDTRHECRTKKVKQKFFALPVHLEFAPQGQEGHEAHHSGTIGTGPGASYVVNLHDQRTAVELWVADTVFVLRRSAGTLDLRCPSRGNLTTHGIAIFAMPSA